MTSTIIWRDEVWDGLQVGSVIGRTQWICNGLLRDWITWQTSSGSHQVQYAALTSCLKSLSPTRDERLEPGEPIRLPHDTRDIPTLRLPYGDVPVVHASAGIRRIIALAYMMVWAWQEHLANSKLIRKRPQKRLVLLIDEVEAHLHPTWQRVIVPSIMNAVAELAPTVHVQIHVVTHSPMVMASAETVFNHDLDSLHHFRLDGLNVILERLQFVKRGRADLWLMSDVFGLEQARSLPAEEAIETAKSLQLAASPSEEDVRTIHGRLVRSLAPDDDFWPRWRYFALQHGVDK